MEGDGRVYSVFVFLGSFVMASNPQLGGQSLGSPMTESASQTFGPSMSMQATQAQPNVVSQACLNWVQAPGSRGHRFYYNMKTGESQWEKPFELMTAIERAVASTVWSEITTNEGRVFYYHKIKKQSQFAMPKAVEVARLTWQLENGLSI